MENRFGNRFAPVKEGDELDVKIEAIGDKGDGIAKKDGFVLVVPGTQVNDEVRVKVTKVLRKVGFAEVVGESSGETEDTETEEPQEEESEEDEEVQETAEDEEVEADEEEPSEDSEDFGEEEEKN